MELVRLKASEFEEAIDFLDLVFSRAYGPTHFSEMLPLCYQPTEEHMAHNFAIRESGRLRAIVGLFPAQIQAGDSVLNLGGIGGVSSHPNDRGKGWMKLLMNRCIEEMENTNTDLSFLTGLRQRYRYFGYEKTGVLLKYQVSKTNLRHSFKDSVNHSKLFFEPIRSSDVAYLEKAKALHDAQPFYCIRPQSDFYLYLLSMNTQPWAALYPSGELAGYLVADKKRRRITEIFAESDSVFADMLFQWLSQQNTAETGIFLAPWQENYARCLGGFAEEYTLTDNGNWRIFNWEKVLQALLKIKNTQHPLRDGSLVIGIDGYGAIYISVKPGTIECGKTTAKPDLELDTFYAMRILLGHFPAVFVKKMPQGVRELAEDWFPLPLSWLIQNYV